MDSGDKKRAWTVALSVSKALPMPTSQISTAHARRGRHTYIPVMYKNGSFLIQE